MKLFIRAHDLGVVGVQNVVSEVCKNHLDGVQMVAYKCLEDVAYKPNSITIEKAQNIAHAFEQQGKSIPLVGAYFNPVHSNKQKVADCIEIFKNYLDVANAMGSSLVGSETGSFNDDKWTYHPQNRTDEALHTVVKVFQNLADYALTKNACIAIEGAFGHVCYDVARLKQAVQQINRPNVKIIFDLYNFLAMENVDNRYQILAQGLATFGRQIEIFHLKDCVVVDGQVKQVAVGKGVFDYDLILREIFKSNPNANLVFEGTTGQDIQASVSFIKGKLGIA